MVADDFESFLFHFRQVDPEPGVNIDDLPAVHTDEVVMRGGLRIKTHLHRIHRKLFYESSLLWGHQSIINRC